MRHRNNLMPDALAVTTSYPYGNELMTYCVSSTTISPRAIELRFNLCPTSLTIVGD